MYGQVASPIVSIAHITYVRVFTFRLFNRSFVHPFDRSQHSSVWVCSRRLVSWLVRQSVRSVSQSMNQIFLCSGRFGFDWSASLTSLTSLDIDWLTNWLTTHQDSSTNKCYLLTGERVNSQMMRNNGVIVIAVIDCLVKERNVCVRVWVVRWWRWEEEEEEARRRRRI